MKLDEMKASTLGPFGRLSYSRFPIGTPRLSGTGKRSKSRTLVWPKAEQRTSLTINPYAVQQTRGGEGQGGSYVFLKKITAIKNVGRFKAARIGGGEYGRFTLIYGGNGRGKTTLCSILRSLQRNDPKCQRRGKSRPACRSKSRPAEAGWYS